MADERKRVDGYLFAWQLSEILFQLGGQRQDANAINPYRQADSEPAIEAKKAADKGMFWRKMEFGLFGKRVT